MIELLCTDNNKKATFIHYYLHNAVLDGKKINICPISENGDIVIGAMNADILIKLNQRTITIFEHDSHIHIDLSENIIFVLYSYGNDKNYRIAFEGNSPDLLITVVGGRLNKKEK